MRNRQRKTNRGVSREVLVMAATEVEDRGRSVRRAARSFGISHVTLNRYVREHKRLQEAGSLQLPAVGYNSHRKVFNAEQERELSDYLTTASTMYFGLSPREVRKLAFQCAKTFGCVYPESWNSNEMTGQEWLTSFLKRNPKLSIHCLEPASLSRATSFNRTNVSRFFTNLATVLEKHAFEVKDIWNSDETGVTTVQAPEKGVASDGTVQAVISGEQGSLVTVAVAVNAQGDSIPPLFVFPQKKCRTDVIRGAPKGSIGTANRSGWMQEEEFLFFLHHFVRHARASSASKVLLLLENHTSHVSVACVDFCKKNGVVLLTFPPHCSHMLQPLDRSVPGPFKRKISACMDDWMKSHPGATATIYDLPGIVAQALPTPQNIVAGFRCAGIWPLNDAVFTDADFAPGFVNDRPAGSTAPTAVPDMPAVAATATTAAPAEPFAAAALPEPAITAATGSCASNLSPLPAGGFRPVGARPFPKVETRKSSAKKKKRVRAILTDSHVKGTLEEEADKNKKSGPIKTKRSRPNPPKQE
ncbi:hypothetical protein SKAU_G00267230 [Synaphobranchus kaupii]|uniref:DDE-1 domain-containing protein n=1 Tax=Synaphobranchus kaupii TaxID=118154 RepID=A0A9Q1IQ92_SYNKA|nr:hypothetical protein SKAU_G00267230 [Synaphobranchus kaupii]